MVSLIIMIEKLSRDLASRCGREEIIRPEDVPLYQYGLELFFSTVANTAVMVVISLLLGHPLAFAPYLAAFIPLRLFAGGYHANAHWKCILITNGAFSASSLFALAPGAEASRIFCILAGIFSFTATMLFAPVPDPNKPLHKKEIRVYGSIARSLSLLNLLSVWILSQYGLCAEPAVKLFFAGELMATVMLVAGYIVNQSNRL